MQQGSHILHLAAYRGCTSTVQCIIDEFGVSPEIRTAESECSPLILAARNGHLDVVAYLVEQCNVDVNGVDSDGATALHKASGWEQPHIVRYLVCEAHADLECTRHADEYTSLMLAAHYGKSESVWTLLELGANLEALSKSGKTTCHIALEQHNGRSLYALICNGADIDVVHDGLSVRRMAQYCTRGLRENIEQGLRESVLHFESVRGELRAVLKGMCDDVIEEIMHTAYPKPKLIGDAESDIASTKKRQRANDISGCSPQPNKKQRLF